MFPRTQIAVFVALLTAFSLVSLRTCRAETPDLVEKIERLERKIEQFDHKMETDQKIEQIELEVRQLKWAAIILTGAVGFFLSFIKYIKYLKRIRQRRGPLNCMLPYCSQLQQRFRW